MNELEQTLQKILEKSLEIAEQTGEFVIDQAPDLLRQFFLWHTIEAIMGITLAVIILLVGIMTIRLWGSKNDKHSTAKILGRYFNDKNDVKAWVFTIVFITAFLIIVLINIYCLMYILIAPKLYLIEYFIH